MSRTPLALSAAVEGIVDDAVVRRLIQDAGAIVRAVYISGGKANLRQKVNAYNHAAARSPWLLLVDLDREECAPALRASWLPVPGRLMCFRVAVREVEAWLLGDRQQIANFLGVAVARVPSTPESIEDPKRTIVDLARHSRRRDIREDMVPRPRSGRSEGPAYASRLVQFARDLWRPCVAEKNSDSLRRCRRAIRALAAD
jgi:hypothetical protein